MFPPNLQKNIQELERQITLLETECEHMETEKQETALSAKSNSKSTVRELPKQPFITGPSGSYSSKILNLPPAVPKIYSASCGHFRTTADKFSRASTPKTAEEPRSNRPDGFSDSKPKETSSLTSENCPQENREASPDQQLIWDRESKKSCQRSIDSIKEVSESSEENYKSHKCKAKLNKNTPKEQFKEQTWCELLREPSPPRKWQEGQAKNKKNGEKFANSDPKISSDEESKKQLKSMSGSWLKEADAQVSPGSRSSSKRRPRSARTKKNSSEEIPLDLNMTKALPEKEIQCMLSNEETENFFSGLNDSIKILHFLIGELKTKLSRERRDDVLNDMQNTLLKLSKIKSMDIFHRPLISLNENLKLSENEENVINVKHTLLALKQFCQELSEQKTALTDEITGKNRVIANFKNKEKEYLSLISSLRFNLEKMKEEADEGVHAKRDLKILKIKLQEETKVIEALKKSHEKMQELIENYVLENDKMRAQVKIAKLESQKYNVLLAGKEVEISKYKKEIESFQRKITEQLSLLRSKATENEIEQTIEAISNHRSIIQAEVDSSRSQIDATVDGDEYNENLDENTVVSTMTITHRKSEDKQTSSSVQQVEVGCKNEWETASPSQTDSTGDGSKQQEGQAKSGSYTAAESDTEAPTKRQYGLERVLSSSKNLRSSINELLEDIRRDSSDLYWPSPSNSCLTSSQSALVTTSSEDVSEGDPHN